MQPPILLAPGLNQTGRKLQKNPDRQPDLQKNQTGGDQDNHFNLFKHIMKNKKITYLFFVLGIISSAPSQSAYDAIHLMDREIGFGTRPLSMGGAFTGLADDYTAIYWNPAGLGSISTPEIYTELSHLNFNNQATFLGNINSDNQSFTRFRSFGLAMPVSTTRGSLVWAIGYNRILDFDDNLIFNGSSGISNDIGFYLNEDTTFYLFDGVQNGEVYRHEQVQSEGGLRQISFGGALALSQKFTIGVMLGLLGGTEEYRLHFSLHGFPDRKSVV